MVHHSLPTNRRQPSQSAEAVRSRRRRHSETDEAAALRRESDRIRARARRQSEDPEAAEARRHRNRERDRQQRREEDPESSELRRQHRRERERRNRENDEEEAGRRREHRNSLQNTRRHPNDQVAVARTQERPPQHYLGSMEVSCCHCGAVHFPAEKSGPGNSFNICCNFGNVTVNTFDNYPALFKQLLTSMERTAVDFRKNIKNYNSALAMTSMGAKLEIPRGHGPYCFRIHGQVYHRIGPLMPDDGQTPQFGQLYILDTEEATSIRAGNRANAGCERGLLRTLGEYISANNPYAQSYRLMYEVAQAEERAAIQENRPAQEVTMVFEERQDRDRRRYNLPTANEVAVIYVGEEVPENRSIAVHERGKELKTIREIDGECDPLTYPVLFPKGGFGWHTEMRKNPSNRKRTRITQREYYSYLLHIRPGHFNPLFYSSKLLQQYVVDSWVKIEQNRLNYDRTHQSELRVENLNGLIDYMHGDEQLTGPPGRRIVLPTSFKGGPRDMYASYQDAMAIVARYGKPDLFVTFTCNPKAREINENLFEGQTASDRPDIVARVFQLKLQALKEDILKKHVLGEVSAYIDVIEFQKRGLPHCHMLLIMKADWKFRDSTDIDSLISAVIPDLNGDPELFDIVSTCMVHRPCGEHDPGSPCMKDGECSKRYPRAFRATTSTDGDGYPQYRRPNDGRSFELNGAMIDNTWIIPHSPYLCRKYRAHINVEVCGWITAVKYLFKYVYKGPDRASVFLHRDGNGADHQVVDEIKAHLDARYVCAPEALHRIFGFDMQSRSDSVCRLQVHLPNRQSIVFNPGEEQAAIDAANTRRTTLTAWFDINRQCMELEEQHGIFPADATDSRLYLYYQMPEHFTFQQNQWKAGKRGSRQLGRMHTVGAFDQERFALRLLLLYTRGATSFESLRTVNGTLYPTFVEAAKVSGYLSDDRFYEQCVEEATLYQMPSELRSLFSCLLTHAEIQDATGLWDKFKDKLTEDYRRNHCEEDAFSLGYFDIADRLANLGRNIKDFLNVEYNRIEDNDTTTNLDPSEHQRMGEKMLNMLNPGQRAVVDAILRSVTTDAVCRCFFVDGPGGSGKTFVYTTLNHILTGMGKKILNVAWTGIAANLLPSGRTVSSAFKLNVNDNSKSSTMKRQSKEATKLNDFDIIIWDEAPMAPKQSLEAADELLRDISQSPLPFGGKLVILGGDFRQVLPVVDKGGRPEMVEACLKRSRLWPLFEQHHLSQNMRVNDSDQEWITFLLKVCDGTVETDSRGYMEVSNDLRCQSDLPTECFGSLFESQDINALTEHAILTPKNTDALRVNNLILDKLPGERRTFKSLDTLISDSPSDELNFPTEFLNKMTPTGLPPHELHLKVGCIVMLLRNLDVSNGLCNGTRLIVKHLGKKVIGCTFACGARKGNYVLIPRIDLYYDRGIPFRLRRRQFPVRLSFAMTINKKSRTKLSKSWTFT